MSLHPCQNRTNIDFDRSLLTLDFLRVAVSFRNLVPTLFYSHPLSGKSSEGRQNADPGI